MTKLQTFLQSNDKPTRNIRVLSYLVVSGTLAYLLSAYIANNEMLTVILAPAINYALYLLAQEIENGKRD